MIERLTESEIQVAATYCASHATCSEACPAYEAYNGTLSPATCRDMFAQYIARSEFASTIKMKLRNEPHGCTLYDSTQLLNAAKEISNYCSEHTCLYCDFRTTKEVTLDNRIVHVLDCKLHADVPEDWRVDNDIETIAKTN